MSTGTPTYPTTIDTNATLGPTTGIIANSTLLGATGAGQGDQIGITNNLINQIIALQTVVGITGSSVTTSLSYLVASLVASSLQYAVDSGTANAYVTNLASNPTAYTTGMTVALLTSHTNTAACTINANSIGAVAILNPAGVALQGGEINSNALTLMIYNGTAFVILGPSPLSVTASGASPLSVNCAGATSVYIFATFTSGSGIQLSLAHVGEGVPVTVAVINSTGTSNSFVLAMSNAAGTSVATMYNLISGTATGGGLLGFPVTMANGQALIFVGAHNGGTGVFSR